jgi:hypothetical protein
VSKNTFSFEHEELHEDVVRHFHAHSEMSNRLMLQLSADELKKLEEKGISQAEFESLFQKEKLKREKGVCFTCYMAHGGRTRMCDGCKTINYCGRLCQKEDWVSYYIIS